MNLPETLKTLDAAARLTRMPRAEVIAVLQLIAWGLRNRVPFTEAEDARVAWDIERGIEALQRLDAAKRGDG